jgi:3-hydroxyacyl-CoA dehydrogenase/enoyl-CoA hydratase/3-hydroxybutyryl-CoA epimerase
MSLAGKRVLITGGGSGAGADLARGFAGAGAEVVISGRRADALKAVAEPLGARWVQADVTDEGSVTAMFRAAGPCDIVIANAGAADSGVMASNTSTLPITGLAQASKNDQNFIGLHFFSPVDKMQLVEIIKGQNTSSETLAKAYDFVQQIGKTPIVVNDSRGFFTSRVFGTFVQEGLRLLAEGVHPAKIEMAALKAGMPVGPLAIQDEVSLTLSEHVANEARKALQAEGKELPRSGADDVIHSMIHEFGRKGKAAGAGFYDYPEGGKKQLWDGLKKWQQDTDISEQEMIDRFLFVQSLDTLRCLEEGVLESTVDGNIGSIFGIGFAPWTGGALQYLNQYGLEKALIRANSLEAKYGQRFKAPQLLKDKIEKGEKI